MKTAELDRRTFRLVRQPQEVRRIADKMGISGPISAGIVRHRLARLAWSDPQAVEALLTPPRPTPPATPSSTFTAAVSPASSSLHEGATSMPSDTRPVGHTPTVYLDRFVSNPDGTVVATFSECHGTNPFQIKVTPRIATSATLLARAVRDGSGAACRLGGYVTDTLLARRLDAVMPDAFFSFAISDGPARPAAKTRPATTTPTRTPDRKKIDAILAERRRSLLSMTALGQVTLAAEAATDQGENATATMTGSETLDGSAYMRDLAARVAYQKRVRLLGQSVLGRGILAAESAERSIGAGR